MKHFIFCLAVITAAAFQTTMAQTKDADPADVGSVDSIMKAVYDVISGEA